MKAVYRTTAFADVAEDEDVDDDDEDDEEADEDEIETRSFSPSLSSGIPENHESQTKDSESARNQIEKDFTTVSPASPDKKQRIRRQPLISERLT